jgi:MFS family permease
MTSELTIRSRSTTSMTSTTEEGDGIMYQSHEDTTTNNSNTSNNVTSMLMPPPSRNSRVWKTLILSVAIGLVSGSLYGFGRYSKDLRDTLQLSQIQVQRFGILLDTGNYVGHPVTGFAYDKLGSKLSCISAAIIVFISYGSIHLGLWNSNVPLWLVDVGFFGVGFGSGLGYIVGLGRATKDFYGTTMLGKAVGFVSSGYGLSSTLVGITYHLFGLEYFFLFWMFFVGFVYILGAIIYTDDRQVTDTEGIINNEVVEEVPSYTERAAEGDNTQATTTSPNIHVTESGNENIDGGFLSTTNDASALLLQTTSSATATTTMEWISWRRLDFWLLFSAFGCVTGSGLFVINNISTMVQSIGGQDAMSGRLVILLSMCSVSGRFFMGILADHPKLCKLDLFRYASFTMAFGLFISGMFGTSPMVLLLTVAMVAFSYGGSWVLLVGILSEFYGRSNFGKDYGLIVMGPALSGFIFNTLSAQLYEQHADNDSGVCMGEICYRNSFLITSIAAVVGCIILSRISKPTP